MAVLAVLAALLAAPASAGQPSKRGPDRYLVRARSAADYGALRAKAVQQAPRSSGRSRSSRRW
jgi:hypothetical protein